MKNKIIFAISFGVLFFWSSLFLSYRSIPFEFDSDDCECAYQNIVAIGGFPFQTFEYGLVGNNWPSPEGWILPFLGNLVFWIAIGFVITSLLGERSNHRRLMYFLVISSAVLLVSGVLYLLSLFD